jgi:hypothetical protein
MDISKKKSNLESEESEFDLYYLDDKVNDSEIKSKNTIHETKINKDKINKEKLNIKFIKKEKCKHVWKVLDKNRVHKKRNSKAYQWYKCTICKKKQKRFV